MQPDSQTAQSLINKKYFLISGPGGQSNGFTRQDWDSTSSSSSSSFPASTRLRPTEKEKAWWEEPPRHQQRGQNNKAAAASTSNVLFKVAKSEKDVIKDWLENIFKVGVLLIIILIISISIISISIMIIIIILQTWEKTNELQIREFKLTQLKHETEETEETTRNGSNGSNGSLPARLNGASNGERWRGGRGRAGQADSQESLERLVIIKLAEISGLVKGGQAEYSVIIKVLPTDDHDRYKVRHKFRQVSALWWPADTKTKYCLPQLLKFSKEVQVYMKIIKCMYM